MTESTRRNLPLDGVLVIDLGQVYQGPYATYLMAKAGATVIKVEPPGGEPVRQREAISRGSAVPFAMLNGHKKCITLDLKSEKGKDVLKELAARADVLLENFAPGAMDRLGLGWAVLHALNPRLVYASGSGYGLSGPDRDNMAMDVTVQAVSGMMSVTGFPDSAPVKAGPAVADFLSGIHLYAGVVTALYERHFTGVGRLVEVAMQEAVYPTMASNLAFLYDFDQIPPRTGNQHGGLSAAPYNVYSVKDGYLAILGVSDTHWKNLLLAMARQDLIDDHRLSDKANRCKHIAVVDEIVSAWSRTVTREQACATLKEWKVPHAPVRDLVEVTNDPHMHQRGFLEWLDHPRFGRIAIADSPIRLHGADRLPAAASPRLGEHCDEVMASILGLNRAQIDALRTEGVFGAQAGDSPETVR